MKKLERQTAFFILLVLLLHASSVLAGAFTRALHTCLRGFQMFFEPGEAKASALWDSGLSPELKERLLAGLPLTSPPDALRDPEAQKRVRAYLRWERHFVEAWTKTKQEAPSELARFQSLGVRGRTRELNRLSDEIQETLRQKLGVSHLGMHQNMRGGDGYAFVAKGGILPNKGDWASANSHVFEPDIIALGRMFQHGQPSALPRTAFYWDSNRIGLGDVLRGMSAQSAHPSQAHFLILFDLDSASARPGISPYSNDLAPALAAAKGTELAVPLPDFLTYPLPVMTNVRELAGISHSLTEKERTFLNLLALKRLIVSTPASEIRPDAGP